MITKIKYQINGRYIIKKINVLQKQNDRFIHFKELVRSMLN